MGALRVQRPYLLSRHSPSEALPINFPHFTLRGAARLSFTARIEEAHSDRAASASKKDGLAVPLPPFQARSLFLQGWGLIDLPLCASNEGWFIWSISSIWLVGPEIHPEEPDRPERPANQTDEPGRVARAQKIIRLHPTAAGADRKEDSVAGMERLLGKGWKRCVKTRRTRASSPRGPGDVDDGRS